MKLIRLKKELGFLNIFTIALGATIASGFFLLPGLAYASAGPGMVLSYIVAAIPVVPALFSMSELATAMPRSGGVYFFLDRSLGPLMGTIGGLGTWFVLVLKTSFALVGIGAYLKLIVPNVDMLPLAIGFALLFGFINLFGAKKSGGFQIILVILLTSLLVWFLGFGIPQISIEDIKSIFNAPTGSVFSTAGLIYVSYVGLSKVASISEEVKKPEKNLPLAMFSALGVALIFYVFGTLVMLSAVPASELSGSLTPVALTAHFFSGKTGALVMTFAAVFAFLSVANAGILSASRYPMAMSRDHLFPPLFKKLTAKKVPVNSVYITVGFIILVLVIFNPIKIAKLAGAFQLLLFAFSSLAVIVMRESKIESYDPGFKSPLYPWMQIFGMVSTLWLIFEMGILPSLFTLLLVIVGSFWYFYYGRGKVVRDGAIYHIFARLGEHRFDGLDTELREILKEKGLREQDPFDAVITTATVLEIKTKVSFESVVKTASEKLSKIVSKNSTYLEKQFLDGTLIGATPVAKGAALPHLRLPKLDHSELVIIRTQHPVGVIQDYGVEGTDKKSSRIKAFFFLISPEENPGQHLRILAQIASHIDNENFMNLWAEAKTEQDIKELLLREDRYIRIVLHENETHADWIGKKLNEIKLPEKCLIAIIQRKGEIIVPNGEMKLNRNDKLTIIGNPDGITKLYQEK